MEEKTINKFIKNLKRLKMYETIRYQMDVTVGMWQDLDENRRESMLNKIDGMIMLSHKVMSKNIWNKSPIKAINLISSETRELTKELFKEVRINL